MKKSKKENQVLLSLVEKLMKTKKPLWRRIVKELSRPRRQKVEVNLSKLEQFASEDTTVIVPGKVLGSGIISKKLTIAAFSFSESAKLLINNAGGTVMSIEALHKTNPEGKGLTILK